MSKSHICAHHVYCVAHCRGFFFVIEETVKATICYEIKIINCLLLKHMNAHTRARTSQWQIWNGVIALKMPSKHNCRYCCIFFSFSSQNALLCMLTNINEEKKDEKKTQHIMLWKIVCIHLCSATSARLSHRIMKLSAKTVSSFRFSNRYCGFIYSRKFHT